MQENYTLLERAAIDQESHAKNFSLLSSMNYIPWDNLEYDFWQYYKDFDQKDRSSLRTLIGMSLIRKFFETVPVDFYKGLSENEIWQVFCDIDLNKKGLKLEESAFATFFSSMEGNGHENLDFIIQKFIDPTFRSEKKNESALFFGKSRTNKNYNLNEERYLHGPFRQLSDNDRKKINNSLADYL